VTTTGISTSPLDVTTGAVGVAVLGLGVDVEVAGGVLAADPDVAGAVYSVAFEIVTLCTVVPVFALSEFTSLRKVDAF
jgi:hypothetical protein